MGVGQGEGVDVERGRWEGLLETPGAGGEQVAGFGYLLSCFEDLHD